MSNKSIAIGSDHAGFDLKGDIIVHLIEKGFEITDCGPDSADSVDYPDFAHEVAKSIEIAYELCDLFIEHNIEMEVHADINTNPQFKSNDALKEAMGYILGMGFAFKAKPDQ